MRVLIKHLAICAVFITLAVRCLPGAAGEPGTVPGVSPDDIKVARKLVGALSSDNYSIREKARESLLKLGRAAIEPLEDATKSEDSETRLRAVELLIALRGRGLLGIGMMQAQMGDTLPKWGAGVKSAMPGLPAAQAGLQSGDVIVALNGQPVPDNVELQHLVFAAGPSRVMDVVADRGEEKIRVPVLLTLNLTPPASPGMLPPVDLEAELPESDDPKARAEARDKAMQTQFVGQGMVIVQGRVVQSAESPRARPTQPPAVVDVKGIEADFEKFKAEAERNELSTDTPASK